MIADVAFFAAPNSLVNFDDLAFKLKPAKRDFVVYQRSVAAHHTAPWHSHFGRWCKVTPSYQGKPRFASILLLNNGLGLQCLTNATPDPIRADICLSRPKDAILGSNFGPEARFHLTALELTYDAKAKPKDGYHTLNYAMCHAPQLEPQLFNQLNNRNSATAEEIDCVIDKLSKAKETRAAFGLSVLDNLKAPLPTCYFHYWTKTLSYMP